MSHVIHYATKPPAGSSAGHLVTTITEIAVENLRPSGIELIGNVPWGTHFCQFYQTRQDLLDTLVPYFRAGLVNNEFCMWVTAEPLNATEAKEALAVAVPDLESRIAAGQIEIIPYKNWYLTGGSFDSDSVLSGWVNKLNSALDRGFDGLRLTGNTFWLEKSDWDGFTDYEHAVDSIIGQYNLLALCTYSLEKCGAPEILDVIRNHEFALVKRKGAWELIENSEHRETRQALQRQREQILSVYQSMHEGLCLHELIYDGSGQPTDYRILDVNPAYEAITGLARAQAVGKKASELYGTGQPPYFDIYERVARTGKPASFETFFAPMDKNFSISVFSPGKNRFATIFSDITERKAWEEALRRSEEKYRSLFNSSSDAVFFLDSDNRFVEVNDKACQVLGYSRAEMQRMSVKDIDDPTTIVDGADIQKQFQRKGHAVFEQVHVAKDGRRIFVELNAMPVNIGGRNMFLSVARDITERKRIEAALWEANELLETKVLERTAALEESHREVVTEIELRRSAEETARALTNRLLKVQEEERRAIARELHDQIGQGLTVAKLAAARIERQAPEELHPALKDLEGQISDIMKEVRNLSLSLRPGVLDELGLLPALEWLFKQLKSQAGLKVEFECPPLPELSPDLATGAFRVVQEALTNVMRYSGVKEATVCISLAGDNMFACVSDHGRGFDPAALSPGQSTGLSAMRERAALLGGACECRSAPGQGTAILLNLPLTKS